MLRVVLLGHRLQPSACSQASAVVTTSGRQPALIQPNLQLLPRMEGAMITSSGPTGRLVRPGRAGRTSITDAIQADGSATGCSPTGIADAQALEERAFSIYSSNINHVADGPQLGDEKLRWKKTAIETAKQVHPDPEFDVLGHSYSLSARSEERRVGKEGRSRGGRHRQSKQGDI